MIPSQYIQFKNIIANSSLGIKPKNTLHVFNNDAFK